MRTLQRGPAPRSRADLPPELARDVILLERLGIPFAVFTLAGDRLRRSAAAIELLATRVDDWGRIADHVRSVHSTSDEWTHRSAPTSIAGIAYSLSRYGADHRLVVFHPVVPLGATDETRWAPLSARERQVAECIANGRTSREVAACLGISVHTARRHTESLYAKLGVRRRTDVARIALGWQSGSAVLA